LKPAETLIRLDGGQVEKMLGKLAKTPTQSTSAHCHEAPPAAWGSAGHSLSAGGSTVGDKYLAFGIGLYQSSLLPLDARSSFHTLLCAGATVYMRQ